MTGLKRDLMVRGAKAELARIADFIASACDEGNVAPDACFDLQLVVEEACSNVIEHAYCGEGGDLQVIFEALGRDVVITIHDHGRPFDPSKVARPDLSLPLARRPIGGLGLHLIHRLTDEVRFHFSEEGNTLVMVKRNVLPELSPYPADAGDSAPALSAEEARDG